MVTRVYYFLFSRGVHILYDDSPSRIEFWEFALKERTASYLYIPEGATYNEVMGWLKSQLVYAYSGPIHHAICEFHLRDDTLRKWRAEGNFNDYGH